LCGQQVDGGVCLRRHRRRQRCRRSRREVEGALESVL
jgi:hypothetical protein